MSFKGTTGAFASYSGSLITGSLFFLPNSFLRTADAELIGFEATEVTMVVGAAAAPPFPSSADRLAMAALGVVITAVLDLKSKYGSVAGRRFIGSGKLGGGVRSEQQAPSSRDETGTSRCDPPSTVGDAGAIRSRLSSERNVAGCRTGGVLEFGRALAQWERGGLPSSPEAPFMSMWATSSAMLSMSCNNSSKLPPTCNGRKGSGSRVVSGCAGGSQIVLLLGMPWDCGEDIWSRCY